jgi:hypothetical protein
MFQAAIYGIQTSNLTQTRSNTPNAFTAGVLLASGQDQVLSSKAI